MVSKVRNPDAPTKRRRITTASCASHSGSVETTCPAKTTSLPHVTVPFEAVNDTPRGAGVVVGDGLGVLLGVGDADVDADGDVEGDVDAAGDVEGDGDVEPVAVA